MVKPRVISEDIAARRGVALPHLFNPIERWFGPEESWIGAKDSGFRLLRAFLAIDSEPDYPDTAALPAAGGVWKYKAIYRLHDEQVGLWSDIVSVSVGA